MKIRELLEKHSIKSKDQIINLGITNGWTNSYRELYYALKPMFIPGTARNKELGRCYTESSVDLTDGEETFTLISRVDSSD
jgi:hypothetical protein